MQVGAGPASGTPPPVRDVGGACGASLRASSRCLRRRGRRTHTPGRSPCSRPPRASFERDTAMRGRTLTGVAMVGAFALLCVGGLAFLAVSMGLDVPGVQGLSGSWRLEAGFAGVEGLVGQSDVDVSGVRVGRVTAITPDAHGGVVVTMLIDRDVRLRQDTRALL